MKTSVIKPISAFFVSLLLLAGCGGALANLNEAEKTLYNINKNTAEKAMELSSALSQRAETVQGYEDLWEKTKEAALMLEKNLETAKNLNLPEETAQLGENSIVALDATYRIVDKARELAIEARGLSQSETPSEAQLEQINKSLDGYSSRLEKSKEKFDNLNTQLVDAR